jgi:hypothetical protein
MAAALKVFTRGTLTFFEITIVVFFIASLAAMAVLGCLGGAQTEPSVGNFRRAV